MSDPNQILTKEKAIKTFVLIVIGTIAFTALGMYLSYGKILLIPILIGLGIALPIMLVSAIIGFKYRHKIAQNKNKLAYVYLG